MKGKWIDLQDLEDIALGAHVYGSGGGGDSTYDLLVAKEQVAIYGPVRLCTIDEIEADTLVAPVGYMGAPMVALEKLHSGNEFGLIIHHLERALQKKVGALVPFEVGGSNVLAPFAAAGRLSLPVVDGDTIGRAFPEVQMSLCTLLGLDCSPAILADTDGSVAIIHGPDAKSIEILLRALTTACGSDAAVCTHPMTTVQAKNGLLHGSISKALEVGRSMRLASSRGESCVEAIVNICGGKVLGRGTIGDISQTVEGGFLVGHVEVHQHISVIEVNFQNEYLAVKDDHGRFLATTPDVILIVDEDRGHPIATERLQFGLRVQLLAIPAVTAWQTLSGLQLVGPRVFGYDTDYTCIEERGN